jgi:hypothetical protein
MDLYEQSLQSAIADFKNGVYKSQRAAAKAWGVSCATLARRLKGGLNRTVAQQGHQRLDPY